MSNLPPGVTGREYAIAGADWSGSATVECGLEDRTLKVCPVGHPEIELHVEVPVCPFEGEVDAETYRGVRTWTCPLCLGEHEDEIDDEPDPDDARDAAFDRMED